MTEPGVSGPGAMLVADGISCGPAHHQIIRTAHLSVDSGELTAITAPSGSGTSLLLTTLAGLRSPTEGQVRVGGRALEPDEWRRHCALLEQDHQLAPELTAAETISLPLRAARLPGPAIDATTWHWLDQVGLAAAGQQEVTHLSGGQRQRVALARCLAANAPVTLLDDPTAELDPTNRARVIELIRAQANDHGSAVLVGTHDPDLIACCRRQLTIRNGQITE